MKIVEKKNKENEKVLPDFIEQEVSNSKFKVPSSYAVNKALKDVYSTDGAMKKGKAGDVQTGNSGNLQPYLVVYMWKRIG